MKDKPLLSVIVPIYNVEYYLEECIESVVSQTYENLDIILIDDGSIGREAQICDRYAEKDDRVTVIHKKNEGLVAARKTGLEYAKAEYIAFVDGDDYIDQDYYARLMQLVEINDPDIVITSIKKIYSNNKEEIILQPILNGVYERKKLEWLWLNMNSYKDEFYNPGIFPSTCTKIYKKKLLSDIIKEVPNGITMGEDAAITYPYLLHCNKAVIDNEVIGYHYRVDGETMTTSYDMSYFDRISALYSHLKKEYIEYGGLSLKRQLDIYRTYLIYLGINNTMSSQKDSAEKISEKVGELPLFENMEDIFALNIPKSLSLYLRLLKKSHWRMFRLLWQIRQYV